MNTPPGDVRLWTDGSYKDGIIGYGALIMPGWHEIQGGRPGSSALEAEFIALCAGLLAVKSTLDIRVYSDCQEMIRYLQGSPVLRCYPHFYIQYVHDNDRLLVEAHRLANKGRLDAARRSG